MIGLLVLGQQLALAGGGAVAPIIAASLDATLASRSADTPAVIVVSRAQPCAGVHPQG